MKRTLSLVLIVALLFIGPLNVFAEETPSWKEEIVYGLLNLDGSVNNVYVVNIFKDANIVDYGDYSEIRNMTSSEKINAKDGRININTTAKRLYYEGKLKKKELPWDIKIEYILDGKKIAGSELAGKSGALEIRISVLKNPKINSAFFDNYALQIALALDTKLADNIRSNNATMVEVGSKKQLTYTILPGKGTGISVKADVVKFETEAITINGIKMNLGMMIDDKEFAEQITKLTDAIKELDEGAGDLLIGVNQLAEGMNKYVKGLQVFKDGLLELGRGVNKLEKGIVNISDGLAELSKKRGALLEGATRIQQVTFNEVNNKLSAMKLGLPVLTPQNYSNILSNIPELASIQTQLDGVVQFAQGLKGYLDGITEISIGASDLAKGASQLNVSTSKISNSVNDLYNAGMELNSAFRKLRAGLEAYKDGTKALRDNTSNIGTEMSEQLEDIMNSVSGNGGNVVSFVSNKNTNVSFVQFIIRTDKIKLAVFDKPPKEVIKLTFWQKLLKLFGFYK